MNAEAPGSAGANAGAAGAIIVIHGIGEQPPYQTLDSFVQGLGREYEVGPGRLEHRMASAASGVRSSIRMQLPRPVGREQVGTLDFYEFHWAGMVRGKIRLHQVLAWLVRTALNPLRFWSQQASVLLSIGNPERARRRLLWRFLGEVGRAILFPLVVALVVAPFFYAASKPQALVNAWNALHQVLGSAHAMAAMTGFVGLALLVIASLRGAWGLAGEFRGVTNEAKSVRWWAAASVTTALVLLVAGYALDRLLDLQTLRLVGATIAVLRPLPIALPLLAVVFSYVLGRILVAYLGDVALYTTADENSEYYRTRAEILANATALVRDICESGNYAAVYLAGHSLGSVIAYDTVNRYIRDARAGTPPPTAAAGLARLRGLLTFGSPLDAVYYFFRAEVGPREPVRAQILSSLHGFRKRPSGRVYGDLTLAPYAVPDLPGCVWMNVWSHVDLVSRRLDFYKVDRQEHRFYAWNPIRAHLAYWKDRGFYRLVAGWL